MPAGNLAHLFKTQASAYSQFRPTYPQQLVDAISQIAKLPAHDLCLDVATGQGQAAVTLSKTFKQVVAIDSTEEQIRFAVQCPNVKYLVADAHQTGMADSSVDLVTVAQAMHWFDLDRFYKEVARVLKPHGCLAAWGYGLHTFPDAEGANAALLRAWGTTFGPYWSERRKLVEAEYRGYEPSAADFAEVHHIPRLMVRKETSINQIVGYVRSWSAYNTFCKQHSKEAGDAAVDIFRSELQEALGTEDGDALIKTELPIFMMIALRPVKH